MQITTHSKILLHIFCETMIHKLVVFKSFIGPDDVVNSRNESIYRVGFLYKREKTEHHSFQENSAFSLAAHLMTD